MRSLLSAAMVLVLAAAVLGLVSAFTKPEPPVQAADTDAGADVTDRPSPTPRPAPNATVLGSEGGLHTRSTEGETGVRRRPDGGSPLSIGLGALGHFLPRQ